MIKTCQLWYSEYLLKVTKKDYDASTKQMFNKYFLKT